MTLALTAPPRVAPAAHVAVSADPTVLCAIDRASINLAIWERAIPTGLDAALRQLDLATFEEVRFTSAPEDVGRSLGDALATAGINAPPLAEDVAMLAGRYAELRALDLVEVRLERVVTDACHRWHADYVSVRLITTYVGLGTEWLDQVTAASVDKGKLPAAAPYQRLATAAVGLFKGRDGPGEAIVHRSPPIAGTGEERLLLVVNPGRSADLRAAR